MRASPLQRRLARLLFRGRTEVQAQADLLRIRGQLRVAGTLLLTILAPGVALAWIGLDSLRGEELAVQEEAEDRARAQVEAATDQLAADFGAFEAAVATRLQQGGTPVENTGELSPWVLVAWRLDQEGRLEAPFEPEAREPGLDADFSFDPEWRAARAVERTDPARAARLYASIARQARGVQSRGQAEFNRARCLALAQQPEQAASLYATVYGDYAEVRDTRGFRLGDLARLKRGELLLAKDPDIGAAALGDLVEGLLAERWPLGPANEATVAMRALELVEDRAERDWVASTRRRLDERYRQLFWANHLREELEEVRKRSVPTGGFAWTMAGDRLFALTRWGDDLYVFALDRAPVLQRLRGLSAASGPEAELVLVSGDQDVPDDSLARRSLLPWLPGWQLAAQPRDPEGLAKARTRRRLERAAILALAMATIATGVVITGRLVGKELDVARTKADFAANVSHELRSPITQIRLKGEALQLGLVDDAADLNAHYDAIVREAERLSRLVDNVLDFSAIERGAKTYTLRPGDVGETVRAAVDSARYSMELRDMSLDLDIADPLPAVAHDPEAVAQVVHNLLSNAAKYGKEGGWIGVEVTPVGEEVVLSVSDRGIGISAKDLPMLFQQFYRSDDPRARRSKGTGLGLTIVKYIAEAHHGQVEVKSDPATGTVFSVHFPVHGPKDPTA